MYTVFDQIEEQGIKKGIEKGREEGIQKTILALRDLNIPEDAICKKVGALFQLTKEEVQKYL